MPDGVLESQLREAIEDLEAYLSDQVAPLLVIDSASVLLRQQPALGAEVIRAWIGAQLRAPGSSVGLEDYLYHAVKKLQLLGRLKLVEEEPLAAWIREVAELLLAQVPEGQRERLRALLEQASAGEASLASTAQVLHRPVAAGVAIAGPAVPFEAASAGISAEVAASMRQFALLLSRFTGKRGDADEARLATEELAPQLLAAAAESARSQGELEQYLASLSRAGLMNQVRMSDLFSTLSLGVPNWWVGGEGGAPAPESAPIQAMHRIVSLADPGHTRAHFRELLKTVARQFNAHALPRAVQVLDVARRLLAEGKVDRTTADLILATAHEDLDLAELMAQTQQAASLPLLRSLLNAYPALTPGGLLAQLDDEPDRTRRRLWLALLEIHGVPAREAALARLQHSLEQGEHGDLAAWRQRNFVYLLHRVRPAAGDDARREIALVARCAELGLLAPLVREALLVLGIRKHADAEAVLRQRLEQLERALEGAAGGPYEPPELRRMLSLVVGGLVRQGTVAAWRAVAEHGLKQKPHLGDTLERLAELGALDLAEDPELVDRLLSTLRSQLPMRVLGFNLRRHEGPHSLVRALQGTRSDAVHRAFSEIAQRFPEEPFGQAAAQVLATWDAAPAPALAAETGPAPPPPPAASLAGDLEAFGLPELLQTLMQTSSSGRLVLRDRAGEVAGELLLREGAVREARVRRLPMPDAFYELLESPQPGTFEFVRQPAAAVPAGPMHDVMGLLMEGMRRYDELQRARALAPDHAYLRPSGARPTAPPEESDGVFIRDLWTRVKAGTTPRQCEEAMATDAYRIRSLLAHWLTAGALEIREAASDAAP